MPSASAHPRPSFPETPGAACCVRAAVQRAAGEQPAVPPQEPARYVQAVIACTQDHHRSATRLPRLTVSLSPE